MQAALGNNVEAMKAFKHVTKLNPPYELVKKLSFMVFLTNIMKNTESEDMASTVLPINL